MGMARMRCYLHSLQQSRSGQMISPKTKIVTEASLARFIEKKMALGDRNLNNGIIFTFRNYFVSQPAKVGTFFLFLTIISVWTETSFFLLIREECLNVHNRNLSQAMNLITYWLLLSILPFFNFQTIYYLHNRECRLKSEAIFPMVLITSLSYLWKSAKSYLWKNDQNPSCFR